MSESTAFMLKDSGRVVVTDRDGIVSSIRWIGEAKVEITSGEGYECEWTHCQNSAIWYVEMPTAGATKRVCHGHLTEICDEQYKTKWPEPFNVKRLPDVA